MAQYLCGNKNTVYDIHHQEKAISDEITKVLYNFLVAPFEPASDSGHWIQAVDANADGCLFKHPCTQCIHASADVTRGCFHERLEAESGVSRLLYIVYTTSHPLCYFTGEKFIG